MFEDVDGALIHNVEEHQKIHGKQAERGQSYLILRLVVEWLTLQQRSNLVLYALRLAQETLVHAQSLEAAFPTANVVDLGCAIFDGSSEEVLGVHAYIVALCLDFGEVIDGQLPVRILGQILERDFGLALSYHHVHNDQALEDNSPCRVAQAVGEGAKYLGDACFARMCRDEDVLDIFGFGRGELDLGPALDALLE